MPITIADAPSTLPDGGKKLYVSAWNGAYEGTCEDRSDRDECASKIAWSAVKRKYKKGADDKWTPKADVQEFSMAITRTSYDKCTNTRNWFAVASDTEDDLYDDNMTLELFQDFLGRIENKEQPPEGYRSDFWSGGQPYLSVSHYPDFNGKGVPGPVDSVYIDGRVEAGRGMLKAKGRFDDTPLGKACFQSISRDIEDRVPDNERIRISIAFLDWKHRHKSTGYEFERTEDDFLCPECLKEMVTGDYGGKEFLKGHLIHLALTRVPVNERTSMEVERSMTTRKEDAETIIGELAEDLEELENEKAVAKSATEDTPALVIKAEEEPIEEVVEKKKHDKEMDEEEEEDEEKEGKKKKKDMEKSDFEEKALHLLSQIAEQVAPKEKSVHVLDTRMEAIKEAYDYALEMDNPQEAVRSINEPFEELARAVQEGLVKEETAEEPVVEDVAVANALSDMAKNLAVLTAEVAALKSSPQQVVAPQIPERRSISPELLAKPYVEEKAKSPIREIARASVGLDPIG